MSEIPPSRVVLVLIDGLRPDAIEPSRSPNLCGLRARSACSMRARSVMPSITLPCHMSLFHSVPPERHGVTTNDWQPMARPLPGLVEQAHAAGLRCASFYNWEPLRNLSRPGALALSWFRDNVYTDPDGDDAVAAAAIRALREDALQLTFVYLGTVDVAGHDHGWMSAAYLEQVSRVDRALGALLAAVGNDTAVLLQSDHGGHDRMHGTESAEDMTIPWIVSGPGIRGGVEIESEVSILDTAPTIARLLGIDAHPQWEGRCVDEAFA